ncbi:MAG: M20/M25/M40 family metallo-hydrolase [Nostocoides sp.]
MDRADAALQAAVRLPTIANADPTTIDPAPFDALHEVLRTHFPQLHQRLDLTPIDRHGLLFHWQGRSAERPVVLMAHLDVVPVDESAPWQHPAFSADVVDGAMWGRGTLDDKGCLVAICEAVERLLESDFVPAQDIWLSFGADEEVSGRCAPAAVEELRTRGVRPWFVIDEGGAIAGQAFPGVLPPVGVVGVTEKGTTTLTLTADGRGGHASTPARNGPTVRIARAILRIEKAPFAARLPAPTIELLRRLAPHAPKALGAVMANAGRLRPGVTRALIAAGPEPAAMTRTTVAVTTLSGAPAANVIASSARAGLNVRVMVGDSVDGVVRHIRKAMRDTGIRIDVEDANEPSPVSPWVGDAAYDLIETTIAEIFPDAIPSPYVMMAATDSRFFTAICERVYRFAPFRMSKEQRGSIHSYDEHLRLDDFHSGIVWYRRLLEKVA